MPATTDTVVHGRAELVARLRALPEEIRQKALASGVMAGARVLRDDARQRAPVRKGGLRDSIVHKRKKTHNKYDIAASVGIKRGTDPRRYAHLVEFGRSATVVKSTGMRVGPVAPRPFLRPAADSNDAAVLEAVRAAVLKRLDKLVPNG